MCTDYVDLIRQKKEIVQKLNDLDARQFAATSGREMIEISLERTDYVAALKKINELLGLGRYRR